MKTRLRRATLRTALAAALCAALWPSAAQALPPETPDESAFVPNADVYAIARSGGLTYIGGAFTNIMDRPRAFYAQFTGP